MKNELKFSPDGKQFQIIFAKGGESDFFTSKEAGFKAIRDLLHKNKISTDDFDVMLKEIAAAKDLDQIEPQNEQKRPSMSFGFGSILSLILASETSGLDELLFSPDKPVEVAYFEMCSCKGPHGRIYGKTHYTNRLFSKKEAINVLEEMVSKEMISKEEVEKVKAEIKKSTLPETEE